MNLELECMYCNYKWDAVVYSKEAVESMVCTKCKDSSLKVKNKDTSKVDYYRGSPPFPEKQKSTFFPYDDDSYGGID